MPKTLIKDLKQCDGQKLLDFEQMEKDIILFDYAEEYSFILYMEKIRSGWTMLDDLED